MKVERGCEKPALFEYWTDTDGELRDRCPRLPLLHDAGWYNDVVAAYNGYKAGFLPSGGGLNDQPALYPHLMSEVDHVFNLCEQKLAERQRKSGNK